MEPREAGRTLAGSSPRTWPEVAELGEAKARLEAKVESMQQETAEAKEQLVELKKVLQAK